MKDNFFKWIFSNPKRLLNIILTLVLIFILSWMNAFVDYFVHPEIPFFDEEHLYVGTITGVTNLILAAIILFRIRQLSEIDMERIKLLQDLKSANENFSGLFNFAPFGYLTLSKDGEIIEANNSAALILNTDKALLTNKKMSFFIADDSQSDFDKCISQLFLNAKKKSCEIQVKTNISKNKHVYVEGCLLGFNDKCLITLVDITDRKLHEIELKKKTNELIHLNSFFVDRELKMVELKNEINELLNKLGNEKKYKV